MVLAIFNLLIFVLCTVVGCGMIVVNKPIFATVEFLLGLLNLICFIQLIVK
jgi:hypothetical protein